MIEMRASEFLDYPEPVKHLSINCWDVDTVSFGLDKKLTEAVSLDISRLGVDDFDVVGLVYSPYLTNLRWLSLAGNVIGEIAVRTLCYAGKHLGWDLQWLDLRGTDCDATPYLDGGDDMTTLWRMPLITHLLLKEYGWQKWMTLGHPPSDECNKYIEMKSYPPRPQ